jgi:sarcosine oxidase subunit gamma
MSSSTPQEPASVPDLSQRLSALATLCAAGTYGAPLTPPGIVLSERRGLTLIDLRGDPANAGFLAAAATAAGLALPLVPNTSVSDAHGAVLCLGPDQWLLIGERFSEALPIAGGVLTDVSHGRAAVRISGPRVRELLAKGCSLDLHPRAWQAAQCAQTSIARVGVLLHALDAEGALDPYCARSYAASLWHWLTEAAAEYGYQVV